MNLGILLNPTFLPKALGCIIAGLLMKSLCVYGLCSGTGFTRGEKVFFAIGLASKATIQAALGGKFAIFARLKAAAAAPEDGDMTAQLEASQIVELVSVVCVLFGAIVSGITMKTAGPSLLIKDADYAAAKEAEKKK